MVEENEEDKQQRDRVYTVWKVFASRGLFPQHLQAFASVSKMHRDLLKECSESAVFWIRLRDNAVKYAAEQFDEQERINFETLIKSPIARLTEISQHSEDDKIASETVNALLTTSTRSARTSVFKSLSIFTFLQSCVHCGVGNEESEGQESRGDDLDYDWLELSSIKRSNHEDLRLQANCSQFGEKSENGDCPSWAELGARRFLRLCYFPVFWLHEYRRVLVFSNVPQKFKETELQLRNRMLNLILKHGRMALQECSFHASLEDLIWSIEAGRKKRLVPCRNYWIPDNAIKETKSRSPWFRTQAIVGVFPSETIVNCIFARKTRFRKDARIYLSKCVLSSDLDRLFLKTTDLPTQVPKW